MKEGCCRRMKAVARDGMDGAGGNCVSASVSSSSAWMSPTPSSTLACLRDAIPVLPKTPDTSSCLHSLFFTTDFAYKCSFFKKKSWIECVMSSLSNKSRRWGVAAPVSVRVKEKEPSDRWMYFLATVKWAKTSTFPCLVPIKNSFLLLQWYMKTTVKQSGTKSNPGSSAVGHILVWHTTIFQAPDVRVLITLNRC